jgi:hypothetical protein
MIHHGNQCFEGLPCLRQFPFGLTSMQSVAVMGQASYPPPGALTATAMNRVDAWRMIQRPNMSS